MSSVEQQAAEVLVRTSFVIVDDDLDSPTLTEARVAAKALADAGLLARELPTRDEIAEAVTDAAIPARINAVLALFRGESDAD